MTATATWHHYDGISPYQTWVAYRATTLQLNLHHQGRTESRACPTVQQCGQERETTEHILWGCVRARRTCSLFAECWTGGRDGWDSDATARAFLLRGITARTPPPTNPSFNKEIETYFGFYTPEHRTSQDTIWKMCVVATQAGSSNKGTALSTKATRGQQRRRLCYLDKHAQAAAGDWRLDQAER